MTALRRSIGFAFLAAALVLIPSAVGAAGDLDRTFHGDGKVVTDLGADDYAFDVAVQRDGKIVAVGVSYLPVGSDFWIARYTAAGALDASFGSGGIIRPDFGDFGSGNAVVIQRSRSNPTGRSSRPAPFAAPPHGMPASSASRGTTVTAASTRASAETAGS
jgi:hypothetical protein